MLFFLDGILADYIWLQTVLHKEEHLRISLRKIITFHLKRRSSPFHIFTRRTNNVKFCVKRFCHKSSLYSGAVTREKKNNVDVGYLVRSNMSSSYRLETKREHIPVSKTTMFWIWKAYVLTILHSESKNGMLIWTQKEKGFFWIIFWPIIFELRQCYRKEKDHNIFILNDVEFHPETLKEEQKMSNFVLGLLPCNISQDVRLNLKGEW